MNASPAASTAPAPDARWFGPGAERKSLRQHLRELTWARMLWTFLYPARGQRIMPTVSGILLISVALGIGSAAYNTSNNILFITLSLLLACLILSGVLSMLNFAKVAWRLVPSGPFRVGQTGTIGIELRNAKKIAFDDPDSAALIQSEIERLENGLDRNQRAALAFVLIDRLLQTPPDTAGGF